MNVSYYVAASLDGYIATADGGVDWLTAVDSEGEDYGYHAFFDSVDALLMGRGTFDQIKTFDVWYYGDKRCWVWTNRPLDPAPAPAAAITPTTAAPQTIIAEAAEAGFEHLWLVGGGKLAAVFAAEKLITTYIVSVVPIILGDGIALVDQLPTAVPLTHTATQTYPTGLVQLTYQPKQ